MGHSPEVWRMRANQRTDGGSAALLGTDVRPRIGAGLGLFRPSRSSGESWVGQTMAERVGFEPTVRLHAQRFSRPSQSTTLAPLPRVALICCGPAPYSCRSPCKQAGNGALLKPGALTLRFSPS